MGPRHGFRSASEATARRCEQASEAHRSEGISKSPSIEAMSSTGSETNVSSVIARFDAVPFVTVTQSPWEGKPWSSSWRHTSISEINVPMEALCLIGMILSWCQDTTYKRSNSPASAANALPDLVLVVYPANEFHR